MLRFLSALFSTSNGNGLGLHDALLDAAIERAIDGTDRRLRALGQTRKRLLEPVATAVRHVIALVDRLPEPIEISARRFGGDPRLRALFASSEHLNEVLGRFRSVRDYLGACDGLPPDDVYGLLIVMRSERRVLGMALDGDALTRDVLQTSVSFSEHRYLAPADSERATRRELMKRAFDFLLERALERIVAAKADRAEQARERALLSRKLETLKAGQWGLQPAFDAENPSAPPEIPALEAELDAIDRQIGEHRGLELGLDESLGLVADTLGDAARWLRIDPLSLNLDYRGILQPANAEGSTAAIEFEELASANGERRVVLLGYMPRAFLPEPADPVRLGRAYLG